MTDFAQLSSVRMLAWTLLHFVWQGAALGLAAAASVRFVASSRRRYAAGVTLLAMMAAAPIATFVLLTESGVTPRTTFVVPLPTAAASNETGASPHGGKTRTMAAPLSLADESQASFQSDSSGAFDLHSTQAHSMPAEARSTRIPIPPDATGIVVIVWLLGVAFFSVRFAGGWIVARRFAHRAIRPVTTDICAMAQRVSNRLSLERAVRVFESSAVAVPMIVGWLRPVVLLPTAALAGLSPLQLEALLAHELAHVRRHDYLVNVLQTVVETLLFYHPAVWWLSARVRQDREECCDDLALEACGDRLVYATTLAQLATFKYASPLPLAATDGRLLSRIRRVLHEPARRRGENVGWLPALFVLLLIVGLVPVGANSRSRAAGRVLTLISGVPRSASDPRPTMTSGNASEADGKANPILAPSSFMPSLFQRLPFWSERPLGSAPAAGFQQPTSAGQAPLTGTGLILGRVVDAESNTPVAGITVTLGPAESIANGVGATGSLALLVRSTLSDSQGRFVFLSLPAASYIMTATFGGSSPSGFMGAGWPISSYFPGLYGQNHPNGLPETIELKDGAHIGDAVIRLWKGAAVNGTVYDEAGEPLVGIVVAAAQRTAEGRVSNGPTAKTDDRGEYHLGTLTAGDYFIVVPQTQVLMPTSMIDGLSADTLKNVSVAAQFTANGAPTASAAGIRVGPSTLVTSVATSYDTNALVPPVSEINRKFAYQSTFYPSALSPDRATVVTLRSGEERSGLDVRMSPVPTGQISGTLVDANGPVPNFGVHLLPVETADGSSVLELASTATDSDGRFSFPFVPAGQFTVWSQKPAPAPPPGNSPKPAASETPSRPSDVTGAWAAQPVTIGNENVSDVTLTLRPGVSLSGRLEFSGASPQPNTGALGRIDIKVGRTVPFFRNAPPAPHAAVDPSSRFTVSGIAPGRYSLRIADIAPWTVQSITAGGRDITDSSLTIGDTDIANVVITFTDHPAQVSGTVQGTAGGPDSSAAVWLFPADPSRWQVGEASFGRGINGARPLKDGSFTLARILPGEYFLVAVSDEQVATIDRNLIEKLAAQGTKLRVEPGSKQTITLRTVSVR